MEYSWQGVLVKVNASVGKFAEGSLLLELWIKSISRRAKNQRVCRSIVPRPREMDWLCQRAKAAGLRAFNHVPAASSGL